MEKTRGKLVVEMRFEVSVNAGYYEAAYPDKTVEEITGDDIIQTEEQNYIGDPDSYVTMLLDNITEVSFDFQPMKGNRDASS